MDMCGAVARSLGAVAGEVVQLLQLWLDVVPGVGGLSPGDHEHLHRGLELLRPGEAGGGRGGRGHTGDLHQGGQGGREGTQGGRDRGTPLATPGGRGLAPAQGVAIRGRGGRTGASVLRVEEAPGALQVPLNGERLGLLSDLSLHVDLVRLGPVELDGQVIGPGPYHAAQVRGEDGDQPPPDAGVGEH